MTFGQLLTDTLNAASAIGSARYQARAATAAAQAATAQAEAEKAKADADAARALAEAGQLTTGEKITAALGAIPPWIPAVLVVILGAVLLRGRRP
ncbi:hypothetical protein [Synoicihabitans lomoniglobus]|uniref:Uncharacterized protein n=1 Tax=Synoicihabitans lomoniglobus TaxID=2909285 RepID=A0AAF0I314_9BACT|nr:hypothetical protein [Opitutaceae bacterium LMO-M01]WED66852.1 hypothetical protein PXH66_08315 [Opitutaceae bacterium LMO-M01]